LATPRIALKRSKAAQYRIARGLGINGKGNRLRTNIYRRTKRVARVCAHAQFVEPANIDRDAHEKILMDEN